MKRSAMRGAKIPDFAALHPGYEPTRIKGPGGGTAGAWITGSEEAVAGRSVSRNHRAGPFTLAPIEPPVQGHAREDEVVLHVDRITVELLAKAPRTRQIVI